LCAHTTILLRPLSRWVKERVDRARHVLVAQVPRGGAAAKHRAVIAFRVRDEARVLFRVENFILCLLAVVPNDLGGFSPQLEELHDDFLLARFGHALPGCITVMLRVAKVIEAAVALPRPPRRFRIGLIEKAQNRRDRRVQAIEIHSIKADLVADMLLVALPQPFDELEHDTIAPHPLGEAFEIPERPLGIGVLIASLPITMDAQRIRPIRFQRQNPKSFFLDQSFRQVSAAPIKAIRAVRCFTDQDHARLADPSQNFAIICFARERAGDGADRFRAIR
jgi:hypothetical protein